MVRKYDKGYYAEKVREEITKNRVKKVVTYRGIVRVNCIFV